MANDLAKTANTKALREKMQSDAAQEGVAKNQGQLARTKAESLPPYSAARRSAWKESADWYFKAWGLSQQVTAAFNTSSGDVGNYYPLAPAQDPMYVQTGLLAWQRAPQYLQNQDYALQLSKPPTLKLPQPAPTSPPSAGPIGQPGGGFAPGSRGSGPLTPGSPGGPVPGPPPLPPDDGDDVDPDDPDLGGAQPDPGAVAGLPLWAWGVGLVAVAAAVWAARGGKLPNLSGG